jgi:uncharacterized protein (TIGR02270 family)
MIIPTPPELILWDVVEEHFEEASYQLERWRSSMLSHRYVIDQIHGWLEHSLEAHLAGLVAGGPTAAERLLYPELEDRRTSTRTTVAALALIRSGVRALHYELLDFVTFADNEALRRDLVGACTLCDAPRLETVLGEAFVRARSPREKAALLEVLSALHLEPGAALADCFDTGFDALDLAAVVAAGRSGRLDLAPQVERHLDANDGTTRVEAVEAGLYLGLRSAWARCQELAASRGGDAARALLLLALLGGEKDHAIIHAQLDDDVMRQPALWALGFTGRAAGVDRAILHLESDDARTARLAAEAIATITGFDRFGDERFIVGEKREEPEEKGKVDSTTTAMALVVEEDDDTVMTAKAGVEPRDEAVGARAPQEAGGDGPGASLVPAGTDALPLLDPYAICDWWEANRHRFATARRYLVGEAYGTPRAVAAALRTSKMRRRHALALELALRSRGRWLVTTNAFSDRQLRQMNALSGLEDGDLVNEYARA